MSFSFIIDLSSTWTDSVTLVLRGNGYLIEILNPNSDNLVKTHWLFYERNWVYGNAFVCKMVVILICYRVVPYPFYVFCYGPASFIHGYHMKYPHNLDGVLQKIYKYWVKISLEVMPQVFWWISLFYVILFFIFCSMWIMNIEI